MASGDYFYVTVRNTGASAGYIQQYPDYNEAFIMIRVI